ncbi:hypothetical protein ASPZODRAFT_76923 [Penicilliopsis zonata CBS 506.65]|uniref:acid phosphatase n=1 Tax=Penicilliopsis zonata CBS 506.65 TaxID=1073090 RepID=A0A1L9S5I3_9EURO|nr:hypothetical protein ASPZODRAFT_76923 [Penicilliopsis zonata CBS 506.65]OJJ42414.1 hypothetical protein ASPZODRAFT_76923 [Penicilliopsis zonata CBS 506.65]
MLSLLLAGLTLAAAQTTSVEYPTAAEIEAARASVLPYSPVSNVKGKAFSRFVDIWLENVDYPTASRDPHLAALAKEGILLTNYWAVTHPSEPNYCASASGDTFGMDNDNWHQIPANVSTIADLFDTKSLAWGEYQEGLPYAGYQGYEYLAASGANDYMRKHNPLILFDSVTNDALRLRQIKNFSSFYEDLEHHRLPQYMFVTPNMTDDGHDTNVTYAGKWTSDWLTPLLKNDYFSDDTLVMLTFDEAGNYTYMNKVYTFLLGGAVPDHLRGTTDDTFYTHYSVIASLSANFGLPSLGRWDCGANLLSLVAEQTGYVNYEVDTTTLFSNETYPGPLSANEYSTYSDVWPVPLTAGECSAGNGIVDVVKKTYKGREATYNYTAPFPYNAKTGNNVGVKYSRKENGKVEVFET